MFQVVIFMGTSRKSTDYRAKNVPEHRMTMRSVGTTEPGGIPAAFPPRDLFSPWGWLKGAPRQSTGRMNFLGGGFSIRMSNRAPSGLKGLESGRCQTSSPPNLGANRQLNPGYLNSPMRSFPNRIDDLFASISAVCREISQGGPRRALNQPHPSAPLTLRSDRPRGPSLHANRIH